MAGLVGLLINLLILVIVLGVIYWIATLIINAMGLPWGPVAIKILGVICLLVLLLWFLAALTGAGPFFYRYPVLR